MLDFTRALDPASTVRYLLHKVAGGTAPLPLRLRSGIRFLLRPDATENTDYGVAYEVFINQDYRPPREIKPQSIRLVVDIGGNVGFSVLYWLNTFPQCRVEVFEPHPLHVAQMRRNLAHAKVDPDRVVIHQSAAGAFARAVRLSRGGTSSMIGAEDGGFEVEVVDIIALLQGRQVDLLKLDAEGSEYEILGDDRFGTLAIRHLVMEWHPREHAETDRLWCEQRLVAMGYALQPLAARPTEQMLWASRELPG